MNEQDKQLLLKDLCARLPYGLYFKMEVDGKSTNKILTPEWINDIKYHPQYFKPYLRPMSSMTEDEKAEYDRLCEFYGIYECEHVIDFFNEHHIDFRGLIPKGLALEATEEMYKFD